MRGKHGVWHFCVAREGGGGRHLPASSLAPFSARFRVSPRLFRRWRTEMRRFYANLRAHDRYVDLLLLLYEKIRTV